LDIIQIIELCTIEIIKVVFLTWIYNNFLPHIIISKVKVQKLIQVFHIFRCISRHVDPRFIYWNEVCL